jgi:hypothetical protein
MLVFRALWVLKPLMKMAAAPTVSKGTKGSGAAAASWMGGRVRVPRAFASLRRGCYWLPFLSIADRVPSASSPLRFLDARLPLSLIPVKS